MCDSIDVKSINENKHAFISEFDGYIWMQMPLGKNEVRYMQLTKEYALDCLEGVDEALYQVVVQSGALFIEKPVD